MKKKKQKHQLKKESREKHKFHFNKKFLYVGLIIVLLAFGYFLFTQLDISEIKSFISHNDFSVNTVLLKLNIPNGGESTGDVIITNLKNNNNFKISFENMDNLVSINEDGFNLNKGETKTLEILFKDNLFKSGVYSGFLVIESSSSSQKIPIILGIEDREPLFAITQKALPAYLEVYKGEKLGMDIKVFNLKNNELSSVKLNYVVQNLNGDVLLSDEENLAIKDTFSTIKTFDIPKNTKVGDYIFITSITYGASTSFSTYFFEIKSKGFSIDISKFSDYLIIIILVIIMLILIFLFNLVRHREETSFLRKQQARELSSNLNLIQQYKTELHSERNKVLEEKENKIRKALLEKEKLRQLKEEEQKQKYQKKKREEIKTLNQNKIQEIEGIKKRKEQEIETLNKHKEKEIEMLKREKEEELQKFREKLKQFEKEKQHVVENIKNKQKKQREEISHLKKQGKGKEIVQKLKTWETERKEMKEIKKTIKSVPQDKVKQILDKKKKETEKEFMNEYLSNLGKKNIKLK